MDETRRSSTLAVVTIVTHYGIRRNYHTPILLSYPRLERAASLWAYLRRGGMGVILL